MRVGEGYEADFTDCGECGCRRPRREITVHDGREFCSDGAWCARAKRIRAEVAEEFARFVPYVHDVTTDGLFQARERERRENREYRRTQRNSLPTVPCVVCGRGFEGPRGSKYCSNRCKQKAKYRAILQRGGRKYPNKPRWKKASRTNCDHCGGHIEQGAGAGQPKGYCSRTCRNRAKKARAKARTMEAST